MHLIFYKTNDVFLAEEKLQSVGIKTKIVPTPVQDKAYCGGCGYVQESYRGGGKEALLQMDYQTV